MNEQSSHENLSVDSSFSVVLLTLIDGVVLGNGGRAAVLLARNLNLFLLGRIPAFKAYLWRVTTSGALEGLGSER